MRYLSFLAFWLFCSHALAAGHGGPSVPACTATPPSAASAKGLTNLVRCDAFSTNQQVDTLNSQNQGYDWYPQSPSTAYSTTPPAYQVNDGTGFSLLGSGGDKAGVLNSGKALQICGQSASPPYYVGTPVTGSFYAEIDMKFSSIQPASPEGNGIAFWAAGLDHYLPGATNNPPYYPHVELDFLEMFPGNGAGQPAIPRMNILEWPANGVQTCTASNTNVSLSALGNPTFTNYNTVGFLFLKSSDNGGTGYFGFYFNNTLIRSCTYSATGTPSCSDGGVSSCTTGSLIEADTQRFEIMMGTGYYPWPVTMRNFHVWQ